MRETVWKTVWQFLKPINIELASDSATPLLGLYPRKLKTYKYLNCIQMFIAALSIIAKK